MGPVILKEDEETRYEFRPFGLGFTKAQEWDGAFTDTKWLWPWIRPYRLKLVIAFTLFLVSTLIAVYSPKLVARIVDEVLLKKTAAFAPWFSLLAILMVLKILTDISYKWWVTKAGQSMTRKLRGDVFHQLGTFPLAFFDKNPSGRLISRCVNDVTNLSQFFTSNFFTVISDAALIVGCVLVLATLSPWAALIVLATLLPLTVFMLNVSQAQMRWGRSMRNVLSRLSSHTADTMNNLAVLHSGPFAARWLKRHEKLQGLYNGLTLRNILTWGSFSSSHVFVMGLTYAAVVALGIHQLKEGTLSLGGFIASCTYVGLIFGPFLDISEKLNTLVTALGSVKRLRAILPAPLQRDLLESQSTGEAPRGNVSFQNISFGYRDDRLLFDKLSFELAEGEVTALVGRTGSGKTTLAHLLLGLYPLRSGDVRWGAESLTHMPHERRARWVAHVSQDLFLFSDTLRENLRLWRSEVSDAMIRERLERVGLWQKIQALPQGLDMVVKAETLPLSQGEKQLLLLTRAMLQDPRLLIFDEATASLDHLSEVEWLRHVNELFQGRTTLFIAHRLETLALATRVVVLEQGQVKRIISKERGTPISEEELQHG